MLVVGLDIGGANLKAASSDGEAVDRPFPLWKQSRQLAAELRSLIAQLPPADAVAVTMTGELADCFTSKAEGVREIVAAVETATLRLPAVFWQTGGEFLTANEAVELPQLVAAANWHALATFCGRIVPEGPSLLIDVGSTTTDLVPLHDGAVVADGLTDLQRLRAGELVYTGAARTPICAFGTSIRIGDERQPLAAEWFATTRDVYLVLGDTPEAVDDLDTADGRPATISYARSRLARMLCADVEEVGEMTVESFAAAIAREQRALIEAALNRVLNRMEGQPHILLAGSGSFIGRRLVAESPRLAGADVSSLAEMFARRVSRSACAFAVARLAVERAVF
ncbi:MAG: hydantoinase/oxoprolinase family protein [Planctomycetaceae bacterium]